MIAKTPQAPYYAVIFTSSRTDGDQGYAEMGKEMFDLVQHYDGFLGMESSRTEIGITVSYWKDLESIKVWKENARHQLAQKFGKEKWYQLYKVRICKVERDYEFIAG
ncbi:MAG: antibiotic biosynthesis monooxygenase [Crocinitomicaceae bacterium]|nr:antibiotic biosynthesis monooxygenase [Crocinitomicaceae bacterium]MBK8925545.1 antibiotic biosynthesis monooxygenase [Crocinitomicaceae bacterium]